MQLFIQKNSIKFKEKTKSTFARVVNHKFG